MLKGRLLILEDDLGVAKVMDLIARSSGLEVRFSADAREFLTVADEWKPTHVTLDLLIPEADGVEVLIEMARRRSPAKIIIISGMGVRVLDSARRTAISNGLNVIGVLAKPFARVALMDLLGDQNLSPLGREGFDLLPLARSNDHALLAPAVEFTRTG
jgi:CheY-like chemotaxis protein